MSTPDVGAVQETVIWEGGPSQLHQLGVYLLCLLLGWLVLPLIYAGWRALVLRCTRYRFTSERFRVTQGVLARRMDELELYRVKDIVYEQSVLQRLFGLADLLFVTSDRSRPQVRAVALPQAEALREQLRFHVERLRRERGIHELDLAP